MDEIAMYDVIECFMSSSPSRQTKLIVFQTRDMDTAQTQADQLFRTSAETRAAAASTFIVVDRSTARELYRVPEG